VTGVLTPGLIGSAAATVAELLASTAGEMAEVMTERSDAERRQRSFEVWTTGLGLALRDAPRGLSLTRWVEGSATALLLLESDEPLPFSRDVRATLEKFEHVDAPLPPLDPSPAPGSLPRPGRRLLEFVRSLEFEGNRIVAASWPVELRRARRILVALENRRADVYDIDLSSPHALVAVRARARGLWPPNLGTPQPGTLVFLDVQNRPLFPPFPPMPRDTWVPIAISVLTDADERRVLIIPTSGPLAGGTYRLRLDLDRPRWRAATPDDTSNYRASATLALEWS
jgi:hypothetical protein